MNIEGQITIVTKSVMLTQQEKRISEQHVTWGLIHAALLDAVQTCVMADDRMVIQV